MFDLLNFNIGGSGFGGDRTYANAKVSVGQASVTRASLPRVVASEWRKVAKKFIAIFDVATLDTNELALEVWENSSDEQKRNVYAFVDALVERALIQLDNGNIFTTAEQEIVGDLDAIRQALRNAAGY